jgi:hypothetical protein
VKNSVSLSLRGGFSGKNTADELSGFYVKDLLMMHQTSAPTEGAQLLLAMITGRKSK